MNKSGAGVGSASIVLIFAVLNLTIFALISLSSANSQKALADAELAMFKGYYAADTAAEQILSELLASGIIPSDVGGTPIYSTHDQSAGTDEVEYACPINGSKELYVKALLKGGSYQIEEWRMRDTGEWTPDDTVNVWQGPDVPA